MGNNIRESLKYLIVFLTFAAIIFGGFHVLRTYLKTRYPIMVVVSQSMVPTLGVGDFIFVGQIPDFTDVVAAPQPEGEIIVFLKTGSSEEYIVHRAVKKVFNDGEWWFTTKGDHNFVEDSRPTSEKRIIGKVVGKIPLLGYFPLFIKTSRGFLMVVSLMAFVFFADYLMPDNRNQSIGGNFPFIIISLYLITVLTYPIIFFTPEYHLKIEFVALAAWFLGCLVGPLSFEDDDVGLMFWLYHFVLVMIPLGCDIVWWTTGITPSMWWYVEGSTVPITWLLQRETPMFIKAFNMLVLILIPGCAIFLAMTAMKRRGVDIIINFSRKIRSL